ncbi:MAG: hypothetical protein ACE5FU_04240 [Nitrospinota bacterium]
MANSIPYEIVIIAYYKRLIAILSLLLLALAGLVAWLISYNMSMNNEFLKRLKTRDIVILEGKNIKIAKVGYRGHRIIRKFVLDAMKDMLTYSAETCPDAIKTAQMVAIPEIAKSHERAVLSEIEQLRNRGGYYLVKFINIKVDQKESIGAWDVVLKLERIYKNELKEKEVKKLVVNLVVKDTNVVSRSKIEKSPKMDLIGQIITELEYKYTN